MSSRGRGGRGGRGGKGHAPSATRTFLIRSAEECGLDTRNMRSLQDLTRPMSLYPDIRLHVNSTLMESDKPSTPKITSSTQSSSYVILKGREIVQRMKSRPFIVPLIHEHDTMSYTNGLPQTGSNKEKEETHLSYETYALQDMITTEMGTYVPLELVSNPSSKKRRREGKSTTDRAMGGLSRTLDNLEAKERDRRQRLGSVGSESVIIDKRTQKDKNRIPDDEEGHIEEDELQDDEDDEEEDYLKNYYESEVDDMSDGKDDDGDAFF